jgi:hypothetical protein
MEWEEEAFHPGALTFTEALLSSGSPWPGRKNSIQRSFGRAEEYMMNPASSLRDGAWIEEEDFSGYWEGPGAPA